MGLYTPLYEQHLALGAEMSDINGWVLPAHYGSQVEEHHQVRKDCGVFDISFMTVIDVTGLQAKAYLQYLLANDVDLLHEVGSMFYSVMLNDQAGIIDEVLVFFTHEGYRLVGSAGASERTVKWMKQHVDRFDVVLDLKCDVAILAIQGPKSISKLLTLLDQQYTNELAKLKPQHCCYVENWFISRTGYTGEDGVEIILPKTEAESLWLELIGAGVMPIGMKARDTLRLEAGYNLYGQDMNENVSPLCCNMEWTIAWQPQDRNFVGREALEGKRNLVVLDKLIGLVSEERSTLHGGQMVRINGVGEGIITSTNFSPTLGKYIALAKVPMQTGSRVEIEIKGKWYPLQVVPPRFVWHGSILI